MLEVAMCDDAPLFSNGLELYVKRFMQQFFPQEVTGLTWRLTRYNQLEQLLKRPTAPDLLLLDVAFSGPDDGLLAGLALRTRWPDMALLFVSSMERYVGRGYECGALGYVIKRDVRNTFFRPCSVPCSGYSACAATNAAISGWNLSSTAKAATF